MNKIFTNNCFFVFMVFLLLGSGTILAQNVPIAQHNTPVTTNFSGWNGTLPAGFSRTNGGSYVGASASTTGGVYAIAGSGFGYQPSSNAAASSVMLTGTYANNTGSAITSLSITYEAFNIVQRSSRLPGWAVSVNGSAVSDLTWAYNASSSNASPDTKTATVSGLNIANGTTFTVSFASDRGAGSGSSPMIGINNVKVESIFTTPPAIFNSETFLADFGEVMIGNTSITESLTFDAEGLTNDVSIAAPSGFELSTDNINWYAGTDISPVGGVLNDVEIYVRFKPTAVGTYSDYIMLTSDGADPKTVLVTGTGIPALLLSTTPASVSSLGYPENGGPSQPFQLTGLETIGLDPAQGDITVSPALGDTSNYEVSTDGITWGSSVLYPYTSANNDIANPTIYIRVKAGLPESPVAQEIVNVTGGGLSSVFTVEGTISVASSIAVADTDFGPYCNGGDMAFEINFTPNGGFISPDYYAQLSNADGTFPNTPTNIVGTGTTSPIAVLIPGETLSGANYRIRVYNDSPVTFSTNDNGHDIMINDTPSFSGITQADTVCANSEAILNLAGLLPGSTFILNYDINGGTTEATPAITADATGNASFNILLSEENNGQTLTINSIERTDITPSCTNVLTADNTVILSVNPLPGIASIAASVVCGSGEMTTISLTGLLPDSTSDINYTINGSGVITVAGVMADALGEMAFTLPLTIENNDQQLEIVSLTRTDLMPNCTKSISGITATLKINERPTAVISGDQSICFGTQSSDISIVLTGTAPWQLTYSDGTATYNVNNITESPYVFNVSIFGTKIYTVTAVEDANCTAIATGISGSATVTVSPFSNGGSISGSNTVCYGSNSGTLTLNDNVGNVVKWQSSPTIDFSNPADIATTVNTLDYTDLTETTYFRAVVSNGTCAAANSAIAVVTVNTTPILITQPQFFCNEALVSDLFPSGPSINWYADAVGGTALLLTDTLSTGNYFASQTTNGCESARTLAAITINTVNLPQGATTQEIEEGSSLADLTVIGTNLNWYQNTADIEPGIILPAETLLEDNTTYYVTQTINGCTSGPLAITVSVFLGTPEFDGAFFKYYPNPVQNVLHIAGLENIDAITIFNIYGQQVMNGKGNGNNLDLDVSNLAAGTYIVSVVIGKAIKTFKVIKN